MTQAETAAPDLVTGYAPGVLAEVVGLHMAYYGPHWGFGLAFETKVATEMAAFLRQADATRDLLLCARNRDGGLLGSVTIHGPHDTPAGRESAAHLRWFIVGDAARGSGVGRRLLARAVAFCDACGYPMCYLTTFAGLDAARHLYERTGFRLVATSAVDQWSGGVQEQRFERPRGG
ncbi:GNAT family N-acetyltransferase [Roseospira goensis]|uniref:GNAT superfamily N-acetyltransferase n=1 Tax=Roseospira goensis TaxID=391922 RepID=A0A7W6RZS3_9PROT|nr:GNAT family N-acetyltransferase [Roseospira goensis]MBB4286236.1 GNAT superfamily N-acetyltransferase [Roseospira goensis]